MDAASAPARSGAALYSDKAPYLVTILVGALAWLVSYTVARYEKVPVIAYSVAALPPSGTASGATRFTATFTNISPAQAVDCAAIHLNTVESAAGSRPPLAKGKVTLLTSSIVKHSLDEEEGAVVLQVLAMQPEAALQLQASAVATNKLRVLVAPCFSERGEQKLGLLPVLKEESLETLVLQHSLLLLWGGAAVWTASLAALYWLSWRRRATHPPTINGLVSSPVIVGGNEQATAAAPAMQSEGTLQ